MPSGNKYTPEQKAAYYAANPDKLKKKLEREAKNLQGGKARSSSKPWAQKNYSKSYGKLIDQSKMVKPKVSPFLRHLLDVKYMSPFDKNCVPPVNPNSLGNFITVDLLSHLTLSSSTTDPIAMVFLPSSRNNRQVGFWNLATGANFGTWDSASPTFKFTSSDAPTNIRPLRAGMKIRNSTRADTVSGVVRVLQTSSPIEWEWVAAGNIALTAGFATEMLNMVRTNSKTKEYTAQEFANGAHEIVIAPATMSAYNNYGNQFQVDASVIDLQNAWEATVGDMSMNVVIVLFEASTDINIYNFTLGEQVACRYPQNTILGQMQRPHPRGNSGRLGSAIRATTQQGSTMLAPRDVELGNAGGRY
jgi:hypothetical protein